jgi:hypothetical protein
MQRLIELKLIENLDCKLKGIDKYLTACPFCAVSKKKRKFTRKVELLLNITMM